MFSELWGSMDNKGTAGFTVSILSLIILLFSFSYNNPLSIIEEIFSKNYIVIPLTIIIAFIIGHHFHKKNKPVQDFWETKRRETIYDVTTCINQIQISLRSIEKHIIEIGKIPHNEIQVSFANKINELNRYIILNYQYLTNMETRQMDLISKEFQTYLNEITKHTQNIQSKENSIITLESVTHRLIMNFKTIPSNLIYELLKPVSNYFVTDEITASRNRRK